MYTYVSWFLFLSFSFALNFCTSFRIYFDSLYVHIRLWILFVSLSPWMSVIMIGYIITHMAVAWSVFLSLCLSLSVAISVFGYIVTDCNSKGTSLNRRITPSFFLSLSVSVCLGNSACIRTSLDSYFFLTFRLNVFTSVRLYYHSL